MPPSTLRLKVAAPGGVRRVVAVRADGCVADAAAVAAAACGGAPRAAALATDDGYALAPTDRAADVLRDGDAVVLVAGVEARAAVAPVRAAPPPPPLEETASTSSSASASSSSSSSSSDECDSDLPSAGGGRGGGARGAQPATPAAAPRRRPAAPEDAAAVKRPRSRSAVRKSRKRAAVRAAKANAGAGEALPPSAPATRRITRPAALLAAADASALTPWGEEAQRAANGRAAAERECAAAAAAAAAPLLAGDPRPGDVLAWRAVELTAEGVPGVAGWRLGTVTRAAARGAVLLAPAGGGAPVDAVVGDDFAETRLVRREGVAAAAAAAAPPPPPPPPPPAPVATPPVSRPRAGARDGALGPLLAALRAGSR